MANSFAIIGELLRANSEIARFQKDKIQELLTKDFPYADSRILIDVLNQINTEIIKIFENLNKIFNNYQSNSVTPKEYENLSRKVINYSSLVWKINGILYRVEQSVRENVAQSTVFLISYLARDFKDSSFFLTPTTEHNFFYRDLKQQITELIEDALPNTIKILSKLRASFSTLSFPGIYRDNIVTNVLLAHEIGHFIVESKKLKSNVWEKAKIIIPKNLRQDTGFVESLTFTIERWIIELLSDMIGFRLCGPVFFFALAEESLSMVAPNSVSRNHPPPKYRLKLLLEEMESCKFIDKVSSKPDQIKIKDLINNVKEYIENSPDTTDRLFSNALMLVDQSKNHIKSIADKETKKSQYGAESFGTDIPKLLRKLEEIIPPCEIQDGKPANIISILNAGMIYKMTWMKYGKYESLTREDVDETERTINGLVLRSIEMSILQDKMLKSMNKRKK